MFDAIRPLIKTSVALIATMVFAACSPQDENISSAANGAPEPATFSECRLPSLSVAVECTNIDVPLKRNAAQNQETISLRIVRLPANTLRPDTDPLILLAGGPGQAASALAPFAASLVEIRRTRDILLIDQRGTGKSSPLSCAALRDDPDETLGQSLSQETVMRANQCFAELQAQNIDPLDYGTLVFVEDIEAIRRALSLKTINLWAGSYGTRVALEYLRRYPENVRTLTLDGVVNPQRPVIASGWQTREARLKEVINACALSESCQKLEPENLLQKLAVKFSTPGKKVNIISPQTGKSESVLIDFDLVVAALQSLLYMPESAALIPYVLEQAADERFEPLAALTQSFSGQLEGQISPALHYAILCAEDTDDAAPDLSFTAPLYRQSLEACVSWPVAKNSFSIRENVRNEDTPVLLLSGALDPVTPPAYAEEAAKEIKNHRSIVAPGYGHILSTQSCAPSLLATFVRTADLNRLPEDCIALLEKSTPPHLWPNALSPEP